jgi:2-hydroxychromene-2-carboxylate isomerase
MDEFPARRRLLGESDPPRHRPEREQRPGTPDVVDEDFDLFGAEDAASALIERLKDVEAAAVVHADDGEPLLSPGFDSARDRIDGRVGAARSLVVFGAFGTPTSHALGQLLDDVRERFVTTVDVAWRHYPDPEAHPRAAVLALACEASAAIHTFWSLAYELLRLRHNDPIDLHAAMERARLDPKRALEAMRAGTGADRIVEDVASALASGVTYTPTLFVDGRRYRGELERTALAEALR